MSRRQVFLGHEELAAVAKMRRDGRLDEADELLLRAMASQAVLDELRKIASVRAHAARGAGDWPSVVVHLESYLKVAAERRDECLKMVNAEPPPLTTRDLQLLAEARRRTQTPQPGT